MCPLFGETFESDGIRRTYREPVTPDKPTGQSAVEAATEYYFRLYKENEAKEAAQEKQRIEQKRQREAAERDAAKRRATAERQAQFLAESDLESALERDLSERIGL